MAAGCMAGGTCVAGGACMVGVCGRGHAWQERQPLQRMVCILFECILVLEYILIKHEWALRSKTFLNAVLLDIWIFADKSGLITIFYMSFSVC